MNMIKNYKRAKNTFPFTQKLSQNFHWKCASLRWPSLSLAPTLQLMATKASILDPLHQINLGGGIKGSALISPKFLHLIPNRISSPATLAKTCLPPPRSSPGRRWGSSRGSRKPCQPPGNPTFLWRDQEIQTLNWRQKEMRWSNPELTEIQKLTKIAKGQWLLPNDLNWLLELETKSGINSISTFFWYLLSLAATVVKNDKSEIACTDTNCRCFLPFYCKQSFGNINIVARNFREWPV